MGNGFEASPGGLVGGVEGTLAVTPVLDVSERQDRREALTEKQVRRVLLVAGRRRARAAVEILEQRIAGNVAGRRDDRVGAALCREGAGSRKVVGPLDCGAGDRRTPVPDGRLGGTPPESQCERHERQNGDRKDEAQSEEVWQPPLWFAVVGHFRPP